MGIPYTRNEGSYRIIRPLLHVPRTAIEDYAGRHRVIYFEDETNSGTGYTRNYIRHNLMKDIRASEHLQPEQLLKLSQDLGEAPPTASGAVRSEEHTSELQARGHL